MVFTIYTIYKYLSCGHLCRHLRKWQLQAIATTEARLPDLDIIEIDSLFVFVADLWAEIYKYLFYQPYCAPFLNFTFPGYRHYKGSIPWPWYYRNRFFIRLCSWPMSYDIQISVLATKMAAILENCICKLLPLPGIDSRTLKLYKSTPARY